ncbi:MAG TPA: retroviral-like aspartic protease family protein [Candidatus Tectomicrobia bacterium]|nr:retroviral-like aspartic protease family protein [Candidatus Tectomicrobia bacterium]
MRWISLWALLIGYVSLDTLATAGEMYRWVDEQGHVHLTDSPPKSKGPLQEFKVYRPSERSDPPQPSGPSVAEPGIVRMTPTRPGGTVVVEVVLNRRLTVPMLLDTGADFTVLTKQVAKDLRLSSLDHLPKMEFKTAGGMVKFPIATLQSLRVGTAEVKDLNVAIDIDGHMPMGLLGMTFLRHFKVTVDQQRGQVKLER